MGFRLRPKDPPACPLPADAELDRRKRLSRGSRFR